ncbi:hypothetical protein AN2575.2 [Aspergillus nidulans FGSC A4]|uniref:Rhodopsin domain-containing protein n=1 Tax=Emericella nidulans (strain FGSC A4 / ATCC 38163 / CBS 112.46 / NRRL 194 / M139) TaxID=227321 RepID=Q5BA55_EMENI|nr:hypothetical protein [Aspergillus nidulans FGSC A4]EAA64680.1 hypothetical protein AN2575.2 [Aspergillus nidulans FGSC A4]CBF87130.1 TPA: conserved hypothetical protein [Aspergillus nidulans FGSC A4]|eukprot:XP_660179.1 hypothetical protein AN2575.2 [Aspergillus nidulans FGSC A4]
MAGTQDTYFPGAVPVPEGETYDPDFSHPWLYTESRAIVIAGLIFSTLSLMLRVYTKAALLRKFGWDDTLRHCNAGPLSLSHCSLVQDGYAHGGIGLHIWNITPQMLLDFQKGVFAAGIVYVPSLALAKASLIILYYRIVGQQQLYRYALYVIAAVVVGYSVAITFALIFACRPIERAWNMALPGTCVDQNSLYIATAITNTVTDVALILVAIPVVWGLNMPVIQKIGLFFMFVVGCANVEANFIIICACLPFMRHFLRRYAPKLIGEGSSAGRYFKSYNGGASTTRSWRRRPEHTVLQDEIELAEHGSVPDNESGVRIMKEVQWNVTEERREGSPAPDEMHFQEERVKHVLPGI